MSPRSKSTPKIQRWIDLLAALLVRRYPVTFERLVEEVPAYAAAPSHEARRRMFERDKDELRAYGVPIETKYGPDGALEGYLIDRREFYLPYLSLQLEGRKLTAARTTPYGYRALRALSFDADELAAIVAAAARARAVSDPVLAEAAESALRKLAFDLPVDAVQPAPEPHVVPARARPDRETFERLASALERRKRVTFRYHSMGAEAPAERTVEPYGLFFVGQHWYLAARDPAVDALRNFRLSRMTDVRVSAARAQTADYEIPRDFRLREHARSRQAWELGDAAVLEAIVRVDGASGAALAAAGLGEPVPDRDELRRFRVRRPDAFARWLLSFGGELRPVDPPDLVARFTALARATLALYRPEERSPDD